MDCVNRSSIVGKMLYSEIYLWKGDMCTSTPSKKDMIYISPFFSYGKKMVWGYGLRKSA